MKKKQTHERMFTSLLFRIGCFALGATLGYGLLCPVSAQDSNRFQKASTRAEGFSSELEKTTPATLNTAQSTGGLFGHVVVSTTYQHYHMTGLDVTVRQNHRTIKIVGVDSLGNFAVENLPAGTYRVEPSGSPDGVCMWYGPFMTVTIHAQQGTRVTLHAQVGNCI
ncbi:MAG TPA: hypothetical protein VKB86_16335 [Pyrinomonadaceae bacterium]|nr:hypothetical protein [Pyrinomonadaceae bacterium]